jgi:proteasome activator subunit 4
VIRIRLFLETDPPGWLAWNDSITLYKPPDFSKSTFKPWEKASEDAVTAVRELAKDPSFWKKLSTYYAEENHEVVITQDNVSCVKSICMFILLIPCSRSDSFDSLVQLLEDEPFEALKPILEELIADKEQNKQRAAAELLAGVLGGTVNTYTHTATVLTISYVGSKHWPTNMQQRLWQWFKPLMKKIFNQNIKTDTLMIWTSFLEVVLSMRHVRHYSFSF